MAYRTTLKMVQRKDARRRKLVAAATSLFGRDGFHATTVQRIVSEAETSTGNFYFYFRNKEDVFAAVLVHLGERISAAINDAVAAATAHPLHQMKAAVQGFVTFLAENPEEARILIVESSGLNAHLEQVRRAIVGSHVRAVEKALRSLATELPPLDPAIVARCWTGAVYEAVYSWLELPEEDRPSAKTVAESVSGFNLRGIGASPELL